MPDGKKGFKLRDFYRAPSGAGDIKRGMDWKYGHGEFKSKETRRKPGESKFKYDIRMKKEGSKITSKKSSSTKKTASTYQAPDPSTEIKGLTGGPSYDWKTQERNPGDLRVQTRFTSSTLPSAPGDDWKYRIFQDETGESRLKAIDKHGEYHSVEPGSKSDKAIRKRYTGSETGDLSNWYGHDTYTSGSYWDKDPVSGEMIEETFTSGSDWKKSYLPYDLAQKHYNPNYKGSKK